MIRLFAMILMAPFWVHFLLAGGVIAFGHYQHGLDVRGYEEKQRLAQVAPPEVMPISAFKTDAPRSMPVEVNLRAQIAIEHNVQLIKTKNGKTVSERSMYILVAPDAAAEDKTAYGAVVLAPSQVDTFVEWAKLQLAIGGVEGGQGPVLSFPGLIDWPSDTSHIKDAMRNQGFTPAAKLIYVEPFLQGRAAGLAIRKSDEPLNMLYVYYVAAFFVCLGLLRFAMRLRKAKAAGAVAVEASPATASAATASPAMMAPPEPVAAALAPVPLLAENDFIGALARKRAESAAPAAAKADLPPAIVSTGGLGDRVAGALSGKLKGFAGKAGGIAAALALYVVIAHYGSALGLPKGLSLMTGDGPQVQSPMAVATAPAPGEVETVVAEATVELVAVEAAPLPVAPAVPEVVSEAPVAPPAAVETYVARVTAALKPAWGMVQAQLQAWRAAPPLGLIAGLLACLIFVPALVLLRGMVGKSAPRKTEKMDPFERLLQRRLAERARAEGTMIGA